MLLELVLAVSFSILVSACCSLLEAALYSLPLSRIEMLAEKRPHTAAILRKLKHDIDQPIAAILTLNTIANTMGAAVAGAAAAAVFGDGNLFWFSMVFTFAILIFSEIVPKTVGVAFNSLLGPYIARPLQILVVVLKPVILVGQAVTRLIPQKKGHTVSAEELTSVARLSRKAGEMSL